MRAKRYLLLLLLAPTLLLAEDSPADLLYRSGKFAEAEKSYRALLASQPKLTEAQVGLVRSMLRQQKIDEALQAVDAALADHPQSSALLAAKGEVQFRRGEMSDAELSYLSATEADPREPHAYLGLATLYRSYSLYGKAYEQLQKAHEVAPNDIDVQREWIRTLPRKERLAAMEKYLAGPHPDDEEDSIGMQEYLDFLKATVNSPAHACKLVSKVEQTETNLEAMYGGSQNRIVAIGVATKLNGRSARLQLDTGAGGIVIGRALAEKAGLVRLSAQHYGGIGDKGLQSGYRAVADTIRIGELEFHDCVVSVSDKKSVTDRDGLIGADVFSAYLINLDMPAMKMRLSPLPKRPEDSAAPTSLNSEGEDQATIDQEEKPVASGETSPQAQKSAETKPQSKPKDRYVAPEMANWTKVFRFGHNLLIPTRVNDSKPMLFILDTGAFANILSVRAGRQVSKVGVDNNMRVRGVSGEVDKVYSTSKATLRFGHLRHDNMDMVTLDLSDLNRRVGTEVSGFLGFRMLRLLQIKLDHRDGLVDFVYDPNKLPLRY